jgi:hypothetical protein
MAYLSDSLHRFELRQSDDDVKTDLEVTCVDCDAVICDAEHGDTLDLLARTADAHVCETEDEDEDDIHIDLSDSTGVVCGGCGITVHDIADEDGFVTCVICDTRTKAT